MPPEPPHSQSEDSTNEDSGAHQAELDGYQPLPAHATDDQNTLSDSSESSSDESDEDTFSPVQRHTICMTINWPDQSDEQTPREESPPPAVCEGFQSVTAVEANRHQSQSQEATGGHIHSTGRQAADQNQSSVNQKHPYIVRKDFSVDRKDSSTDRKCPSADGKDSSADGKDFSVDRKSPSADGKDSSADGKGSSADRKDSSADRKGPSPDGKDSSADRKGPSADGKDSSADRKGPSAARLSEDEAEAVRRAMQSVRLPAAAVPDWARGLSEQQCEQRLGRLVARITGHT